MHETRGRDGAARDPLAEIMRAVGRRAAPPQAHYDEVYAAARAAWRRKLASRRKRRWFALAASLAVIGIGAALVGRIDLDGPVRAASIAVAEGSVEFAPADSDQWAAGLPIGTGLDSGARIRTGADGRTALQLADGGSLRLDSNTEVLLDEGSYRIATGKLYFDSDGRSAANAIAVRTPFGVVRDIGTQFEVDVGSDRLRIRVREGEVALFESVAAGELVGAAGDAIELSAAGDWTRSAIAPDDPVWAWVESLASAPALRSQSIALYLRWIARETGKRLEFESRAIELSAEFASFSGDPSGLKPSELLEFIAATSDFDFAETDNGSILIGRNDGP